MTTLTAVLATALLAAGAPLASPLKTFSVPAPPAGYDCQSNSVPQGSAELIKCKPKTLKAGTLFFVMLKAYEVPPGDVPTLKTIVNTAYMNNYRKLFQNVKVVSERALKVAGVPAYRITISATHASLGAISQTETVLTAGKKYLVITLSGTAAEMKQYGPAAEAWLRGFKPLVR
jgi:hypothetical protein